MINIFRRAPLVFSFIREQRVFLFALLGLLSFLAVLTLGLVISLSTAVHRWNVQWDLMATVQVMPGGDTTGAQNLIAAAAHDIVSSRNITTDESQKMLSAWMHGGNALAAYIPQMTEIHFSSRAALNDMQDKIVGITGARLVTFASGMRDSARAGWQIILISGFILLLVIGAIILCVSYITRNTTMIHRRELEILNQVGATDGFVARQIMRIIAELSAAGAGAGFILATPVLLIIIAMAHKMKTGMFTQMALPGFAWIILIVAVIGIVILSVWTARKTVLGILKGNN